MRNYFGTDGIRNVAGTKLSPKLAFNVAKAAAYVLQNKKNSKITVLIGKDTRLSGDMIESAMISGFLSMGADVKLLGVIPTPAVAYLTKELNADASVVISASHNSYEYNGIKFFSNKGMKIPDEIEEEIEQVMENENITCVDSDRIGTYENISNVKDEYIKYIVEIFKNKFEKSDFKVVIDTANGATYKIAEEIFSKLNVDYEVINNNPNGLNINKDCGSTHIQMLKEKVMGEKFDLGIAYDGDGDRCLFIDNLGNEVEGDVVLAILSNYFKEKNMLNNNALVATVVSNIGLEKYSEKNGITLIKANVGDRYVLESMLKGSYNLGGENSGHIIFLDYNPTGDGILTSLMMLQVLLEKNITLNEASKIIKLYPQITLNAKASEDLKKGFKENDKIVSKIQELEKEFENTGRILVRASGTEPLIRVMIEGENIEYITKKAQELVRIIEDESL